MIIILLIIASGVLGYEIVFSELAHRVKKLLLLDKDYYGITAVQYPSIINKWLGKLKYVLFPIVLPLSLLFKFHQYCRTLLKCQHCTSFWTGSISTFLIIVNLPIAIAIACGLCAMVSCALYNLIRLKTLR